MNLEFKLEKYSNIKPYLCSIQRSEEQDHARCHIC